MELRRCLPRRPCVLASLKGPGLPADTPEMFVPRPEAPEPAPEQLLGLRRSLNAPVVSTDGLAPGPARALLLVHKTQEGECTVTLGVRSLPTGQVLVYGPSEPPEDERGVAITGADPQGRDQALALWRELLGEGPGEALAQPASDPMELLEGLPEEAEASQELLLDEFAQSGEVRPDEPGDALELPGLADWPETASEAPDGEAREFPEAPAFHAAPELVLTKFRGTPLQPFLVEPGPEARPRGARLGRVRLVKRPQPSKAPGWGNLLLRLFSSF
jgi:hypothetical protein